MLQPFHFDGEKLNSLGEEKLDLMRHGDGPDAITTIYLNFPESDSLNQRRDDVVAYMRDSGVDENHLKFISGPNPATFTPSAAALARIDRTENTGEESSSTGSASTGQASSSSMGSSSK